MVGNKKFEKYYWTLGVVVITLIAMFILILFIMVPLFKGIGKSGQDLKTNKQELSLLKDKLDKLRVLKDKESDLKDQENVVNGAIPDQKDVGGLFVQIDGMIAAANGSTTGIKEASANSSASSAPAATTASGAQSSAAVSGESATGSSGINLTSSDYSYDVTFPSYNDFKNFLSISENAHRFVYLNSFQVDTSQGDSFKVSLNYKAYYRQSGQTGGSKQ